MAKKRSTKKIAKKVEEQLPDNVLPQNILPVGERVEEDKNIYISQSVYKEIHKFTQNKTANESGGMLVGNVIEEFGKTNIVISGFVEAKHCEATPTTLTFTHDTWDYVHSVIDKKFAGQKIVGWIHTHPDFGIFLSEYDKFIQENFFKESYQIAYVVDPIRNIEGFYFWINDKIEKCKGFYIYDKTGVEITVGTDERENDSDEESAESFPIKNILLGMVSAVAILLMFAVMSLYGEVCSLNDKLEVLSDESDKLQSQQQTLASTANQSLKSMNDDIDELSSEIAEIAEKIGAADDSEQETEAPGGSEEAGDESENGGELPADGSTEDASEGENAEPTEIEPVEPTDDIEAASGEAESNV